MAATDPASEPAIVGLGPGGMVASGYGGGFDATMAAQPTSPGSGDAVGAAVTLGTWEAPLPIGTDGKAEGLGAGLDCPTQAAAPSAVVIRIATRSKRGRPRVERRSGGIVSDDTLVDLLGGFLDGTIDLETFGRSYFDGRRSSARSGRKDRRVVDVDVRVPTLGALSVAR